MQAFGGVEGLDAPPWPQRAIKTPDRKFVRTTVHWNA